MTDDKHELYELTVGGVWCIHCRKIWKIGPRSQCPRKVFWSDTTNTAWNLFRSGWLTDEQLGIIDRSDD
jgi:hypothetical protein